MAGSFQRSGLRKAAAALGGEAQLHQFLGVPAAELSAWLRDRQATVPDAVMRKVVNLLADLEAGLIRPPGQPAPGSMAGPTGSEAGLSPFSTRATRSR